MTEEIRESYRKLEVETGAPLEAVKEAYRELMKVWHPDRFPNDPKFQRKATEKTKALNEAFHRITAHLAWDHAESRADARTAQEEIRQARAAGRRWQDTYLRWSYGALTLSNDAHDNSVAGNVVMMPFLFPKQPGQPATTNVTLEAGEAFTMTVWGFVGNSYADGRPPDAFLPLSLFQTLQIKLSLDGVTLIDSTNAMHYFTQFTFIPPIPYESYPYNKVVWSQAIGVLHIPLSVGKHGLKLDAKNIQPVPPNFGHPVFELHNTWNISVEAGTS
jgi:hypothetical protein